MTGRRAPSAAGVLAEARARRRAAGGAFLEEAAALTDACHAMADRFDGGGRLLVWGGGLSHADARHVVVEFLHPVIVGKRALPALAIEDPSQVGVVARPADVVMTIASGSDAAAADAADAVVAAAAGAGTLAVSLCGGTGDRAARARADHVAAAAGTDPLVTRELHVTAYHVLWELVHVFLEGAARVDGEAGPSCPACADEAIAAVVVTLLPDGMARVRTPTGSEDISVALVDVDVGDRVLVHAAEAIAKAPDDAPGAGGPAAGLASLYPFLYGGAEGAPRVEADVRASTEAKIRETARLRDDVIERECDALIACAAATARAFAAGGTLFTFGNGGSSTDAAALAHLFTSAAHARPLRAVALPDDAATLTALANDVSFDVVYSRQLAALAQPGDIACGISTSGDSENVNLALRDAAARGLERIGLAGGTGGNMMDVGSDHLFVVDSPSVHRVQEAQTTLYHLLWELTHAALR